MQTAFTVFAPADYPNGTVHTKYMRGFGFFYITELPHTVLLNKQILTPPKKKAWLGGYGTEAQETPAALSCGLSSNMIC